MPAAKILLAESDAPSAVLISAALTVAGHDITTVQSSAEALSVAIDHELVVIDVLPGATEALELCARIRGTRTTATLPIVAIAASDDVDERVGFLEAGADDVIARPFEPSELELRIEALLMRRGASPTGLVGDASAGLGGECRILAVFGPKGGVGTTTIAVNLAVAAAAARPGRTLLIDLDLRWGQAATHLNLTPERTILDVVQEPTARKDGALLKSFTARHESGLHVLAAPRELGTDEFVTPDAVLDAIRTASGEFDVIVIDAGSELDSRSITALDVADVVVLPIVADIPSLKPVVQLVEYLAETGTILDKSSVVLSQIHSRQVVGTDQIEGLLGRRIAATIPHDEAILLRAASEGNPAVRSAPRSAAGTALARYAADLLGLEAPVESTKRGVFGIRR